MEAHQAPPPLGFSRQEHWSGLPFPSPMHESALREAQRRLSTEELMLSNCGVGELLRVPRTKRRSNQSILKETNCEYSSEGLIMKPKLQYFGHLMGRADSLEKTLMLGKIEARRR